jgi:hypothetical protein
MENGILQSVNMPSGGIANISLAITYKFGRNAPSTAKTAEGTVLKTLNYSLLHDC